MRILKSPAVALAAAAAVTWVFGGAGAMGPGARAPELRGAEWLNTAPLDAASLRGKVRLVEFWTFG